MPAGSCVSLARCLVCSPGCKRGNRPEHPGFPPRSANRMVIRTRTLSAGVARAFTISIALLCGACAEQAPPSDPAPVRLLSSNGVRAAIEAIQPQIEKTANVRLVPTFSTAAALKRQIDAGEAFDIAILTPVLIDDLVMQGKIAADSRADLARVGVGVGAREGAPRSDVSTPPA
jgi:ABC-type molybdate transport system substrate-binding protein